MAKAHFEDLIMHFTKDQTPRVWSLLVTVFGELAQEEGAQIQGTLLSKLTSLMGIKPEAMRVALHRLRKDGWIQSQRNGRTSDYSLTEWGRTQSALATPRIYDPHPLPNRAWIVLFDPGQPQRKPQNDGIWIASNVLVTATPDTRCQGFVSPIVETEPLPEWMADRICRPEIVEITQRLHDRLEQLQFDIAEIDTPDCFEIAALRILIVDDWRRIVLKTPDLPEHVFPAGWMGQQCRDRVTTLLGTYEKQDLKALKAAL